MNTNILLKNLVVSLCALGVLAAPALAAESPKSTTKNQAASMQKGKAATAVKKAKAPAVSSVSEEQQAREKLLALAQSHTANAAKYIRPGKSTRSIEKRDKDFVATYRELDTSNVSTDMSQQDMPGCKYVGSVAYVVHDYECKGKSVEEARRSSDCTMVKSQRMREMTRYDKGKWHM